MRAHQRFGLLGIDLMVGYCMQIWEGMSNPAAAATAAKQTAPCAAWERSMDADIRSGTFMLKERTLAGTCTWSCLMASAFERLFLVAAIDTDSTGWTGSPRSNCSGCSHRNRRCARVCCCTSRGLVCQYSTQCNGAFRSEPPSLVHHWRSLVHMVVVKMKLLGVL